MSNKFYVQIIEDSTGKVVEEMGPHDERTAEKIHAGVSRNFNYERFTLKLIDKDAKDDNRTPARSKKVRRTHGAKAPKARRHAG